MTALCSTPMDETSRASTVEDVTQSLHAWSLADDADTVIEFRPHRGWGTPAAVTALALSVLGVAVFLAWPHNGKATPLAPAVAQPAVVHAPAMQPESPDQRFIAMVQRRGVRVVSSVLAVRAAHATCTDLSHGFTAPEIAQQLVDTTPGTDLKTEAVFVDTVQEVYCP